MTLSWGIAGTGRIARDVGGIIARHPRMRVAAVASRDLGRAEGLAAELGGGRGYASYRELVEDPEVQAVYVATPHSEHAAVVEPALRAGRAVLCEKPMTDDLAETERLVALAAETGAFLMEGVWMRFNPLVRQLKDVVADGGLGEIRSLHACFGFPAAYDAAGRLWDPALGGGALLDLGVYAVDLARLLLGAPSSLLARGSYAPTGADAEAGLLLSWPSGAHATLEVSLLARLPGTATVVGSAGWAEIGPSFHAPMQLVVQRAGEDAQAFTIEDRQAGFTGELEEVEHCLAAGFAESTVMPWAETVGTMRLLHQARARLAEQVPA